MCGHVFENGDVEGGIVVYGLLDTGSFSPKPGTSHPRHAQLPMQMDQAWAGDGQDHWLYTRPMHSIRSSCDFMIRWPH